MEKRRLGRGLDALLGLEDEAPASQTTAVAIRTDSAHVPVERIKHNPWQPRKSFDAEDLASLAASVKTHGILQPLVVRKINDEFQLIAGERRLRAAQEIGLATVPVHLVDFNDQQVLEAALVENIQRADLNPIEKAQGFKDYLERFQMSHDELAKRLGLGRPTITNLVNLLELAAEVQEAVRVGQISEAHAKLLKGIKNRERQVALCKRIIAQGLSVKMAEGLIRDHKEEKPGSDDKGEAVDNKTAHVKSLEDELRQKLSTRVEIKVRGKERGQILIQFETNDDFERLLEVLGESELTRC